MRSPVEQTFIQYSMVVPVTPIPINANTNLQAMVDGFVICLPAGSANPVFIGDSGVTITNGIEIVAGNSVSYRIEQVRQLYEIQHVNMKMAAALQCETERQEDIPFVVFNMSNWWLVAVANTTVTVQLFKAAYI